MKRIVEKIYRVGEVSETLRITTESAPVPLHWRLIMWMCAAELAGTVIVMSAILVIAIGRRHGWLS